MIKNLNENSGMGEGERLQAEALFREFSVRLGAFIGEFRKAHGFDTGAADPFMGQTIITNGLLHEAALNAVSTCFVSGDTFENARRGFVSVFSGTLDSSVEKVFGTFMTLKQDDFPAEGPPLAASLITAVINGTRPTLGGGQN